MTRLRTFFPREIAGQSLRSGGATSLAEAGADLAKPPAVGLLKPFNFTYGSNTGLSLSTLHTEAPCVASRCYSRAPRPPAS